jgi:hypothetical protein
MNYTIDDIADFILVHYTMSNRQDTLFWKDMRELGIKLKHKDLLIGYSTISKPKSYTTDGIIR